MLQGWKPDEATWAADPLTLTPAGPSVRALHDQFPDEFGERGEYVEHETTARNGGVQGLVKQLEADAAPTQPVRATTVL